MNGQNKADLAASVVIGVFGLFVIYEAFWLPYASEFGPGPGFFPLWIGVGLLALALLLGFSCISSKAGEGDARFLNLAGRSLGGWLALMVGLALLPWLGFALSLALLTAFLIFSLEGRSLVTAISVGLGLALGFHLIFALTLGLRLPSGPWGF
ncbi:MAG: tripartite tricarboxylate transporter TctB family protein [Candidatus Binatia bacterium]